MLLEVLSDKVSFTFDKALRKVVDSEQPERSKKARFTDYPY